VLSSTRAAEDPERLMFTGVPGQDSQLGCSHLHAACCMFDTPEAATVDTSVSSSSAHWS